jgi:hypothetical protein
MAEERGEDREAERDPYGVLLHRPRLTTKVAR